MDYICNIVIQCMFITVNKIVTWIFISFKKQATEMCLQASILFTFEHPQIVLMTKEFFLSMCFLMLSFLP